MKNFKLVLLGGIFILGLGFYLNLPNLTPSEPAQASGPGFIQVVVTREIDNQPVSGANVTINCTTPNVNLTENPANSGIYEVDATGPCTNNDALTGTVQVQGFVDVINVAFANNYNSSANPDCGTNVNCLTANNFQFGHRFNVTDSVSAQPVPAVTISTGSVFCTELVTGSFFCAEPEGAGCPTTAPFTAVQGDYDAFANTYNVRCNGNDAQEVIPFQMVANGGSSFNPDKQNSISLGAPSCQEAIAFGNNRFEIAVDNVDLDAQLIRLSDSNGTVIGEHFPQDLAFGNDRFTVVFDGDNDVVINTENNLSLCAVSGNNEACAFCPVSFNNEEQPPLISLEPTLFNFEPIDQSQCPLLIMDNAPGAGLDVFDSVADIDINLGNGFAPLSLPSPNGIDRRESTRWTNPDGSTSEFTLATTGDEFLATKTDFLSGATIQTSTVYTAKNDIWIPFVTNETITTDTLEMGTQTIYDLLGNRTMVFVDGLLQDPLNWPAAPPILLDFLFDASQTCAVPLDFSVPIPPPLPPAPELPLLPPPSLELDLQTQTLVIDCHAGAQAAQENSFNANKLLNGIEGESLSPELLDFLICTDDQTLLELGLGERISVLNSYFEAYGHLPVTEQDFEDLIAIALGITPETSAEQKLQDAKDTFAILFGEEADENDPRDKETLDRLTFGLRPDNRDLDKEIEAIADFKSIFGRNPESNNDWNTTRALAYHDTSTDVSEAVEVIKEGEALLADGNPCPPEYVAKLNAQKAALEGEAAALEAAQGKLKKEITDNAAECKGIEGKIADEQKKSDKADKDAKDLGKEISDLDKDIKDLEKDINDLQKVLAGGEGVEEHKGDKPLDGKGSGSAITFDGGKTWIVGTGEAGTQQLIENIENNQDIVKDLNSKNNARKAKEKQKKNKEKEKAKKEKEKAEADAKKKDLEKEKANKKKEKADNEKKFDALGQKIADLNALIAQFNAVAAECDVAARSAARAASNRLDDAQDKLENMPPDLKDKAEQEFEETATEGEKNADSDAGYAGGVADSAAEKLEEAMRNASGGCVEGHRKCGAESSTREYVGSGWEGWFETMLYLRGSGLEGDTKYRDMIKKLNDGFDAVDKIDKLGVGIGLAADTLAGGSALAGFGLQIPGLAYGVWQDIAKGAAINKIKEIRNVLPNPALQGHRHLYGGWDKYKKRTFKDVYVCEDGIYQQKAATLIMIETQCELADAFKTITIPEGNLPDYREKEDGKWANPDQLQKYHDWSKSFFEKYGPFEECKLTVSEFSPDCS